MTWPECEVRGPLGTDTCCRDCVHPRTSELEPIRYKGPPYRFQWTGDRESASTISTNVTKERVARMRETECPRCGYRYKPTRRTKRYAITTRDALAVASLAFHALQVHAMPIEHLRQQAS